MTRPKKRGSRYTRPTRHRVTQLEGTRLSTPDYDDRGEMVVPPGPGPVVISDRGVPFVYNDQEAAWIAECSGVDAGLAERLLELQTMRGFDGQPSHLPAVPSGRSYHLMLGNFDRARAAGCDVETVRAVQEWNFRFLEKHDLAHRDAEGEWVVAAVIRIFSQRDEEAS